MVKTVKVRLYPDKEQIILLEKHPGSCRFVYNHFYEVRIKYWAEHRKAEVEQPHLTKNVCDVHAEKRGI